MKNIIPIILALGILNFTIYKFPKPTFYISAQNANYQFNKSVIETFSFGQKRLITALLWVNTLLNLDLEHYKKKDLNSWPYLRFDLIASLDKKFYMNYLFGSQYLSVVKSDKLGAEDIFARGTKEYPDDYSLNFAAGYHYYFELGKTKEAIKHFKIASRSPNAGYYLPSLIARLESQENNLQSAYELVEQAYQNASSLQIKNYYYKRMYDIKATIDLNCLNKNQKNCNTTDLDGNPYIKKAGRFYSQRPISPLQVFKRKKN